MSCNFIFPSVRINPEYRFDEVMSAYNYNFSLIQSGCTGGGFSGVTSIIAGKNIITGGTIDFPIINLSDDISINSISATTLYVINEDWTIELIDALTVDFYAPYVMQINSVSNVLNSPSIMLFDDDVAYTLGNTIAIGSKISVSANTASVVTLKSTH